MSLLLYQGSTPHHEFGIPFPKDAVSDVLITYAQEGEIIVEKTGENVTVGDYSVSTDLTQEETLMFSVQPVSIQLKIKTTEGRVIPSDILPVPVMLVLNKEVF